MIEVEMLRPTADEMLSGLTAGEAMKQKMLFRASGVEKLGETATEMLGGLHASSALRHRILVKATRRKVSLSPVPTPARRPSFVRLTPAVGMALVVALMIGLGLNYGGQMPINGLPIENGMHTYAAGQLPGEGVPAYRSLFAGEGANPPLIGVNGRYYRMLQMIVPPSLVGTYSAEVTTFTDEPSNASAVGIVSNVLPIGTKIYEVSGLSYRTAYAAEVDGVMRLFQRVGYASSSLIGNETLEDTLDISGKVAALELSGVGVITDETVANDLIYSLLEFAVQSGSEVTESTQALTIYLQNNLSLQLLVDGDVLGGCGAWACPDFITMFTAALAE